MKKLFFALLLPIFMNSQTVVCEFRVIKDKVVIEDTLTFVNVKNITKNISYTTYIYNTAFHLDSDCEYMLTFMRDSCTNKMIHVVTNGCPRDKSYWNYIDVNLVNGNPNTYNHMGSMWYNQMFDQFRYKAQQ